VRFVSGIATLLATPSGGTRPKLSKVRATGRPETAAAIDRALPNDLQMCSTKDFHFDFIAMGSPCAISLHGGKPDEITQIAGAAIAEIRRIKSRYSRYSPDSELSKINRVAAAAYDDPHLLSEIRQGLSERDDEDIDAVRRVESLA
jgi:hypothetical protein